MPTVKGFHFHEYSDRRLPGGGRPCLEPRCSNVTGDDYFPPDNATADSDAARSIRADHIAGEHEGAPHGGCSLCPAVAE